MCVPIDPAEAEAFDPDTVCTVAGLLSELGGSGQASAAAAAADGAQGWELTSLADEVDKFQVCCSFSTDIVYWLACCLHS